MGVLLWRRTGWDRIEAIDPGAISLGSVSLNTVGKEGCQDAQAVIDCPRLSLFSWSRFAGEQVDLPCLGWMNRTCSSFRLEAECGDVGFYHLRRDYVDLAPGSVEPVEKMGKALRIGTKGVS